MLAGRWLAGDAFGYVLLATVIGPIAAVVAFETTRRRPWLTAVVIVLIVLPVWIGERPATAERVTILIAVWVLCLTVVADASRRWLPGSAGVTVTAVVWLTWAIGPLVRADAWGGAWVLALNPVLAVNAMSDRAGDWTHQAVAYRWLTVLGQDVPMEWPESAWISVFVYGLMTLGIGGGPIVRKRLFHVEH